MLMRLFGTVWTLNSLIRTCRDGEAVCRAWSGTARSPDLCHLLSARSQEWARQADELQALVLLFEGRPARAGLPERVRRTLTLQASRLSAHHHRLEDLRGHFAAQSH